MLTVKNVGYEAGGHEIFQNVSLSINKGDKIGLVGKNGIGKTTLLNIIAGKINPTEGSVSKGDYEVGILPQDLRQWLDQSVYDFIEEITGVTEAKNNFEASYKKFETNTEEKTLLLYSDALDKYTKFDVANFDNNLEKALAEADISNIDPDHLIGNLSGGQRTRVALAAILASRHDVVLLDEPTNNLDTKGIVVLEKFIGNSKAAFMMVSHDRRFLRSATSRIIELMGGDQGVTQYGLGYDEYIESRKLAREAAFKAYDQQEAEKKRLKKAAKDANMRSSMAASRSKSSDNDKLNSNFRKEKAAAGLSRAAKGIESRLEKLGNSARPPEDAHLNFKFQETQEKKNSLVTLSDLVVSYDEGETLLGPLSLHLRLGDKVAIEGENGTGKTSLLKAIVGKAPIYSGKVNLSKEVKLAYMDQDQSLPIPNGTPYDNLQALAPHLEKHDIINLLVRFNVKKDIIETTKAHSLSGGERAKIILASIAANEANLIIMDEPTNNLDIPTIEALESALKTYNGGIMIVSHDRDFVRNIGVTEKQRIP